MSASFSGQRSEGLYHVSNDEDMMSLSLKEGDDEACSLAACWAELG